MKQISVLKNVHVCNTKWDESVEDVMHRLKKNTMVTVYIIHSEVNIYILGLLSWYSEYLIYFLVYVMYP